MDRKQILFSMFDSSGFGLEIGPSYNPLVPKSGGYNVEIIDYIDQEGLRTKYKQAKKVDTDRIEYVDHVSDGRPMADVIDKSGCYDYIIASHVVEHTPDIISFFNNCFKLLKKDGVLVLAVPDKRFCFDFFQPLSTTGSAIQAWLDQRKRPLPGAVFDSVAYDVVKTDEIGWSLDNSNDIEFNSTLSNAFSIFNKYRSSEGYIDVHVWRFVPSSFRLMISDVAALGLSELKEARFEPGSGEFYVSMSASGQGSGLSRIELARMAMHEQVSIASIIG